MREHAGAVHAAAWAAGIPGRRPLDTVPYGVPRAVTDRDTVAALAAFLCAPAGPVLMSEDAARYR
ncbi:hypothetical protein [Streptomyces sp. NBC_01171]|uniref:hypothetical protein n=1 Tax=Streptomyces sp. NBC_01171 TaxID=2903757 RepID=UPI00386C2932|nr:hypothetical protein OG448_30080 [Streptomyces sp. NBC_01171]